MGKLDQIPSEVLKPPMKNPQETINQKPEHNVTQEEINRQLNYIIEDVNKLSDVGTETTFSKGGKLYCYVRDLKNEGSDKPDYTHCNHHELWDFTSEDYLRLASAVEEFAVREGIEIRRDF